MRRQTRIRMEELARIARALPPPAARPWTAEDGAQLAALCEQRALCTGLWRRQQMAQALCTLDARRGELERDNAAYRLRQTALIGAAEKRAQVKRAETALRAATDAVGATRRALTRCESGLLTEQARQNRPEGLAPAQAAQSRERGLALRAEQMALEGQLSARLGALETARRVRLAAQGAWELAVQTQVTDLPEYAVRLREIETERSRVQAWLTQPDEVGQARLAALDAALERARQRLYESAQAEAAKALTALIHRRMNELRREQ